MLDSHLVLRRTIVAFSAISSSQLHHFSIFFVGRSIYFDEANNKYQVFFSCAHKLLHLFHVYITKPVGESGALVPKMEN